MSFVALRFDRAGRPSASVSSSATVPAARRTPESGVHLVRPVLLLVGVNDDVAASCEAAAGGGVAIARVAHGIAACRIIRESAPALVVLSPSLWRDERTAIAQAAELAGTRVLDLAHVPFHASAGPTLVRAALAEDDELQAAGSSLANTSLHRSIAT
jgi:hypothetical protein